MNEKALRVLEYNKIIALLCENTVSALGRDIAENLEPASNLHEVRELQQETTEAVNLLLKKGNIPLGGIHDIRNALKKVKIGASLDALELIRVADTLRACRRLKSFINEDRREETYPIIEYYIDTLAAYNNVEEAIYNAIENDGEIADRASILLHTLRRKIKDKSASIREKLNHYITSSTYQKYLQEPIITLRGDRHVIPVKQEHKASIPGIVHDQSASGATLFIEPMAVVEMHNELKQLRIQESDEIERILAELSAMIGERQESINTNIEILATLDFIFAKAKFSLQYRCVEPVVNDKGIIRITKARHPLLKVEKVVPIDIHLGDTFTTLVVTGPNTGGKTVTLKTVGLLTLMAQSGLHIPASDNSEIAVFDEVFADIGDEQSIEQSLSTFSSHMTNIVKILENVTPNSLALFDELGAGTDPTEGAALAMAILSYLYERNVKVVATTHYSELKVYALSTQGVCNACVEFDIATLRPTYKLLIGIPGKSNAFEISRKLGLSNELISRAKSYLSSEDVEFEDIIKNLEENKKEAEEEKNLASRLRLDIEKSKSELEKRLERLESQRDKMLRDAQREAMEIVKKAKEEAEVLVKELKDAMEKESSQKAVVIEKARLAIKKKEDEIDEKLGESVFRKGSAEPPKNLKLGDTVKIVNLNQKGYVLTLPDSEGNLSVQAGIMKINVHISNIKLEQEEKQTQAKSKHTSISSGKSMSVGTSVDVRGQTLEEAMMNVDKYLDDAYLAGVPQATIIHGKGTGVLRAGIMQLLKSHSHVKSYRSGGFNEGGIGATIVEIK